MYSCLYSCCVGVRHFARPERVGQLRAVAARRSAQLPAHSGGRQLRRAAPPALRHCLRLSRYLILDMALTLRFYSPLAVLHCTCTFFCPTRRSTQKQCILPKYCSVHLLVRTFCTRHYASASTFRVSFSMTQLSF